MEQQDESWLNGEELNIDWIEWHGSSISPLPDGCAVRAITRCGNDLTRQSETFRWTHQDRPGDIVKFRIIEPELMRWCEWESSWNDGKSPVPRDYVVEIKFRDGGDTHTCLAGKLYWGDCEESSIVEYQIVEVP